MDPCNLLSLSSKSCFHSGHLGTQCPALPHRKQVDAGVFLDVTFCGWLLRGRDGAGVVGVMSAATTLCGVFLDPWPWLAAMCGTLVLQT